MSLSSEKLEELESQTTKKKGETREFYTPKSKDETMKLNVVSNNESSLIYRLRFLLIITFPCSDQFWMLIRR